MSTKDENWFKHAMSDPQDYFDSAKAVLEDSDIDSDKKLDILKNWKDQIEHRLNSSQENMCKQGDCTDDERLQEVSAAIAQINTH